MNISTWLAAGPPFLIPGSSAEWGEWLRRDAPDLAGILAGLLLVRWALRFAIRRGLRRLMPGKATTDRRRLTIISTVSWFADVFLVFIGIALVLDNLGMNVTALVASAGIAGLGLTLGAQQLVRDLINGAFILAENQYTAGDRVTVAGVTGEVIEVNPRRTVIRDAEGAIHSVPNSVIGVATNHTPGDGNVSIELPVSLDSDLDTAMATIRDIARDLASERPDDVVELPRSVRVAHLSDAATTFVVTGRVRPHSRDEIAAELRLRIRAKLGPPGRAIGSIRARTEVPMPSTGDSDSQTTPGALQ